MFENWMFVKFISKEKLKRKCKMLLQNNCTNKDVTNDLKEKKST